MKPDSQKPTWNAPLQHIQCATNWIVENFRSVLFFPRENGLTVATPRPRKHSFGCVKIAHGRSLPRRRVIIFCTRGISTTFAVAIGIAISIATDIAIGTSIGIAIGIAIGIGHCMLV